MTDKKMAAPWSSREVKNINVNVSTLPATHRDMPVLDLQKGPRERLRIVHTNYKGRSYIDLRIWYVDTDGEYKPSARGVSIRPEHLAQVVQGLMLAARGASGGL
jgi:hypothetical protein